MIERGIIIENATPPKRAAGIVEHISLTGADATVEAVWTHLAHATQQRFPIGIVRSAGAAGDADGPVPQRVRWRRVLEALEARRWPRRGNLALAACVSAHLALVGGSLP
jgi:hypothetical protein